MSVVVAVLLTAGMFGLGLAAHEAGHVLGAAATRMSVVEVRLGRGWRLARLHLGQAQLRVDLGRPEGWVRVVPRGTEHLRRRIAVFAAAGPLVGVAFALTLLAFPYPGARIAAAILLLVNALTIIPLPAVTNHPSGAAGTDGYAVLRAIRNDRTLPLTFVLSEVLRRARSEGDGSDAVRSFVERAEPDDPTATIVRVLLPEADDGDLEAALVVADRFPNRRACLTLIGSVENQLVWDRLARGGTPSALAVEAMGLALDAQPDNTGLRDTFAWALAATGHPGAGSKESDTTLEDDTLSPADRASCLLVNAICLAGVGDIEGAERRRAESIALDPDGQLLPIADRALAAARDVYAPLAEPDDAIWDLPAALQPVEVPDGGWGEWIRHRLVPGIGVLLVCVVAITLAIIVATLAVDL